MSSPTTHETADLIDLIVKRAPELRAAGVLSMTAGGVILVLAPADPLESADDDPEEEHGHPDPLLDPATYLGGNVPTFERDPEPDPEGR